MDDNLDHIPVPDPFVNEDIAKPENRTNLALFALMNIPHFSDWIVHRLGLPQDTVIYPPQNVAGNLRPDFVTVSSAEDGVSA